jgi:hypothetical protein
MKFYTPWHSCFKLVHVAPHDFHILSHVIFSIIRCLTFNFRSASQHGGSNMIMYFLRSCSPRSQILNIFFKFCDMPWHFLYTSILDPFNRFGGTMRLKNGIEGNRSEVVRLYRHSRASPVHNMCQWHYHS